MFLLILITIKEVALTFTSSCSFLFSWSHGPINFQVCVVQNHMLYQSDVRKSANVSLMHTNHRVVGESSLLSVKYSTKSFSEMDNRITLILFYVLLKFFSPFISLT